MLLAKERAPQSPGGKKPAKNGFSALSKETIEFSLFNGKLIHATSQENIIGTVDSTHGRMEKRIF